MMKRKIMNMSGELLKCPKDGSVLWPSITEDFMYLCPICEVQYSEETEGELVEAGGKWVTEYVEE